MRWFGYFLMVALVACADAGDGPDTDNTEVSDVTSEAQTELSVRTGDTDIGAFRTTISAQPYSGNSAWDVYVGSWLGLYTEVVIERASGTVVSTLVEID